MTTPDPAAKRQATARDKRDYRPNWKRKCENCGSSPVAPVSGLCGPCHFGEADMVNGGWWDEGKDDWSDDE